VSMPATGIFRSLRGFNYRVWTAGALVSNIGTWMQRTAQDTAGPWENTASHRTAEWPSRCVLSGDPEAYGSNSGSNRQRSARTMPGFVAR
jgi:hypothetical protein